MQFKKVAIFAASAVLLVSCGGAKTISGEEAKKKAADISEKVADESFKVPEALSMTAKVSSPESSLETVSEINHEAKYIHTKIAGKSTSEEESVESWFYVKDGAYVAAVATGENKGYTEVKVGADLAFEATWKVNAASIQETIKSTVSSLCEQVNSYVDAAASASIEDLKVEFKSSGDGNLSFVVTGSGTVDSKTVNTTVDAGINNYLPDHVIVKAGDTSSETKFSYSVNPSYPDLSKFTKA